jgi:hypothetical protein
MNGPIVPPLANGVQSSKSGNLTKLAHLTTFAYLTKLAQFATLARTAKDILCILQ